MIVIRVVSHAGQAPPRPVQAAFEAGGHIGRGADCTLVLPDPQRRLSRRHAEVLEREGRHYIRQLGNGVPVEVDQVPLGTDTEAELPDGARIRIGPWLLLAERQGAPASAPRAGQPGASLFDDLLSSFPEPTVVRPVVPAVAPVASNTAAHDACEVDLLLEGLHAPAAPPAPGRTPSGAGAGASSSVGADAFVPTAAAGLVDASVPPEADPSAADALQRGLALPPGAPPVPPLLAGQLLRALLQGTVALLAARTVAKRELGAQGTLMQPRGNNPLKFSPDVDSALRVLLGPPQRGFLSPMEAVDEAFADLQAHELAVVAGMRAALHELLARFDPQRLEQQMAAGGGRARWGQTRREAQLWQAHVAQYQQMLGDIDGEFDTLFVRAFNKAYQAQLDRLAQGEEEP
jgi:type VI secretion system FHA domain protein